MNDMLMERTALVLISLVLLAAAARLGLSLLRKPVDYLTTTRAPVYGYVVVRAYPHDPDAFTQGLVYLDGFLYESTGLHGKSSVRKIELETGKVLRRRTLDEKYFGEGLAAWGPDLFQVTWQGNRGFVYDRDTFTEKATFTYGGQGWGLTQDGGRLIMSDGSATLRFLDPRTLEETGRMTVRDGTRPVTRLNELEYVRGEIYANVWKTDLIARISPRTGRVQGWIDLRGLWKAGGKHKGLSVLNGIAYDVAGDRLFVTGKLWPRLFEIKPVPRHQ